MSHHLTTAAACGSFAAECRVGRIYQLTAESAGLPAATALQYGAQQQNAGNAMLTRLNTDLSVKAKKSLSTVFTITCDFQEC